MTKGTEQRKLEKLEEGKDCKEKIIHKRILWKENIIKIFSILFWLVIWHMAAKSINQEFLLASPIEVLKQTITDIRKGIIWEIAFNSLFRILAGFFTAVVLGTGTAILSYRFRWFKIIMDPLIMTIKSVTTASVIILFLVWFKSQYLSVIVSLFMVFPIVYTSILQGLSEVDRSLLEMAQVFRISPLKKIIYIYVSQVIPYFESAGTASLGLAWKSGIAAEVIGLPAKTIGINLYDAKIYLNTASLFSWTIIIIILSFLSEKAFLYGIKYCIGRIEGGRI